MKQVPLNPKYRKKFGGVGSGSITIPERWEDFAPLLTIRSGKGFRKFEPFPMQLKLSELYDRHSFILNPKCRQLGQSEFSLSKILHWALINPGYNAVVISRTLMDAYKLGKRTRQMIDSINLPTKTDSVADIVLFNGSRIVFCQPGDSAARGEASVSCVMLDEFSFMREPELTLSAALPATSMLGDDLRVIIIFTPNGKSNYSFKLLNERNPVGFDLIKTIQQVRDGKLPGLYHWTDRDGWLKILLHWREHPLYGQNPNYLKDTARKQKMPWKKVLREHDLSFEEGELQFISDELIDARATAQYEPFQEGCQYYAGMDTSSCGADYFAFAVVKVEGDRLSLVHLYRARRKAMKRHLVRIEGICEEYRIRCAAIETNAHGQLYFEHLTEAKPLIQWERFNASQKSNISLLERMLMRMENGTISYPSDPAVIRELRGLEQDPISGKIEAGSSGSEDPEDELHDDIPRSLSLAIFAYENRRIGSIDLSKITASSAT